MKKGIIVVAVALLAFAGYFVSTPYRAVDGLKTAIESGNQAALEARIDFPELRKNMKEQMTASLTHKAKQDVDKDPMGAFAAGFALTLVDKLVDALVTPESLSKLMQKSQQEGDTKEEPLKDAKLSFASHDRFQILFVGKDGKELKMFMHRKGLEWKLASIELPPPQ